MPSDPSAVAAIAAVRKQWDVHFNAGKIAELVELFYTEDAYALPPDTPHLEGRAAIRDFFQAFHDSGQVEFQLDVIRIEAAGEYGYVTGSYVLSVTPPGGSTQRWRGETNEAFRKDADGAWRCCADMWHHVAEIS